jgi:biofilm PGA synthesis N-glycosyltransferase PgaC
MVRILLFILLFIVTPIVVGAQDTATYLKYAWPLLCSYLVFAISKQLFFTYQMFRNNKQGKALTLPKENQPSVTVLVPCYNEEAGITNTLDSLNNLTYQNYRVIVVDDGSKDLTLNKIYEWSLRTEKKFDLEVISQENKGKAAALNNGIKHSFSDYVMCVDADSVIKPDSIEWAIRHFKDDKVAAVAGFVEVSNQDNILTVLQQYEYMLGLNFIRKGLSNFGIVTVIPGPIGIFKREYLEKIGEFKEGSLAEDAELSLRIMSMGYKIISEPNMISYTEAPESWEDLLRQRRRWNKGIFEAIGFNIKSILKGSLRNKLLGLYLLLDTYMVMFINLTMLLMFMTHYYVQGNAQLLDVWLLGIVFVNILNTIMSAKGKALTKWIPVTLLSQFTYNFVLIFWRIFSFVEFHLQSESNWDKIKRKGKNYVRDSQ